MIRWVARAFTEFFKLSASLVAENFCLRQQLLVLQRRQIRTPLSSRITPIEDYVANGRLQFPFFFARDPDGFPLEFLEHNEFSRMGLDWPPFAQPGS